MTDDPKNLTARQASERYYIPMCPGMAPRTVKKVGHQLTQWERFTSNPPIGQIAMSDFVGFRKSALERGLSAGYIECIVSDVSTILRYCAFAGVLAGVPIVGKRLRRRPRLKPTPTVEDLAAAYRFVEVAEWPVAQRWGRQHDNNGRFVPSGRRMSLSIAWWEGVFATLYFTALRRGDLLSLTWDEVQDDRIVRRMTKTGFELAIPIHPVLQAHLDRLPHCGTHVFGRINSPKQSRRELHRMCEAAGVRPFEFQSVRRLAAQAWQRARPGCGSLILGHAFRGADRYYLDPFRELQAATATLEVPAPMVTTQHEIVETVRTMDPADALKALQAAVNELAAKGTPA